MCVCVPCWGLIYFVMADGSVYTVVTDLILERSIEEEALVSIVIHGFVFRSSHMWIGFGNRM